ncbi:MAG: ABC transporter permease subunit, partial [Alphaproteobacteria bacterium]|nr:ABC transporter permease subunit [Alphaproteobacteria bacterium]
MPGALGLRRLRRWTLNAVAVFGFVYLSIPLIFVTWLSFYQQAIPNYPPEGYSVRWYSAAIEDERFIDAFVTSLKVGVLATLIGLLVALPAALAINRRKFTGSGAINNLLLMPLIVPGIVLGFALFVFQVQTEIKTGLPILGSFSGLVFGHVLLVVPWATRLILASLAGFDRTLEEAALNLGANRFTAFRRITVPSILPG